MREETPWCKGICRLCFFSMWGNFYLCLTPKSILGNWELSGITITIATTTIIIITTVIIINTIIIITIIQFWALKEIESWGSPAHVGFGMFVGKCANYTSNCTPRHMWKVPSKLIPVHSDIEPWFIKKKLCQRTCSWCCSFWVSELWLLPSKGPPSFGV